MVEICTALLRLKAELVIYLNEYSTHYLEEKAFAINSSYQARICFNIMSLSPENFGCFVSFIFPFISILSCEFKFCT